MNAPTNVDSAFCEESSATIKVKDRGVAVLLELARVLASGPPREVTYRVVFFDGEAALRAMARSDVIVVATPLEISGQILAELAERLPEAVHRHAAAARRRPRGHARC